MRISDSHRMLFVHVQKTGGVSVETLLDRLIPDAREPYTDRHPALSRILAEHPETAAYWSFAFVRNPWARMVSWWAMVADVQGRAEAGDETARWRLEHHPMWAAIAGYGDFETFVERGPVEYRRLRRSQLNVLQTPEGRRVDFVGRTETIDADVRAVLARLGLPAAEVPHENSYPHAPYGEYYTAASRDRVGELFARDIEAFGYEF